MSSIAGVEMNETKKYDYDTILELLGGYSHFEKEQVDYVFHKLNGNIEEAEQNLAICLERADKLKELCSKLKTPQEMEEMNKKIENLLNTDVEK
jgi:hypothetical protein